MAPGVARAGVINLDLRTAPGIARAGDTDVDLNREDLIRARSIDSRHSQRRSYRFRSCDVYMRSKSQQSQSCDSSRYSHRYVYKYKSWTLGLSPRQRRGRQEWSQPRHLTTRFWGLMSLLFKFHNCEGCYRSSLVD